MSLIDERERIITEVSQSKQYSSCMSLQSLEILVISVDVIG